MSEWHPGIDALPVVPAPWRSHELLSSAPRAPMRRREPVNVARLVLLAMLAFGIWQWKLVLLFMLLPMFFGGWCRCCWW